MTTSSRAIKHPPVRRRKRRVLLVALFIGCAAWFYWQRVHRPHVMLTEARSTALRDAQLAEQQVAGAIAQSVGAFPEAQLFHAQLLESLGRTDEALGQFTLIDEPQQLPAAGLCELGRTAMTRGDLLLARRAFAAVAPADPLFLQAARSLIQIDLQLGNDDLVMAQCRRLLEREPTDATAWQILGTVAMNQKDLAQAASALRQCLMHGQDEQQLRKSREDLVQVLIDQGESKQAREQLALLETSPDGLSPRALIEAAYVDRMDGAPQAGIDRLQPLLEDRGDHAVRARYLRGLLYGDLGQDELAVADLDQVVTAQPWNKEAHHKLSIAYSRLGQPEKSTEHRATAEHLTTLALELLDQTNQLATNPSNDQVRRRVVELYRLLGQPEEAARLAGPPVE